MALKYLTRSAKPGEPSVLWVGKSGRQYRSIVAAKTDKEVNAYTPQIAAQTSTGINTHTVMLVIGFLLLVFVSYKILR